MKWKLFFLLFSDDTANQFKQKYLFENITFYKDTYNLKEVTFLLQVMEKESTDGMVARGKELYFLHAEEMHLWMTLSLLQQIRLAHTLQK